MYLSELTKIVNALPPVDLSGGPLSAAYVNMKNFTHLTAIIQGGVSAGAVSTVTVEKSATGVGAGTAINFKVRKCETAYDALHGDLLTAAVEADPALLAAGFDMSIVDNIFYVIELEASDLGPTFPYVRLCFSDAAAAQLGSCVYVLSGARYQEPTEGAIKV